MANLLHPFSLRHAASVALGITALAFACVGTAACGGTTIVEDDETFSEVEDDTTTASATSASATASVTTGGPSTGGSGGAGAGGAGGGDGGAGGELSDSCIALQDVRITDVTLDAGPDNVWEVGETATVFVTLETDRDFWDYPGVRVSHAGFTATPLTDTNFLFGLSANQPMALGVSFRSTTSGFVGFNIAVEPINEEHCPGVDTATLDVNVE